MSFIKHGAIVSIIAFFSLGTWCGDEPHAAHSASTPCHANQLHGEIESGEHGDLFDSMLVFEKDEIRKNQDFGAHPYSMRSRFNRFLRQVKGGFWVGVALVHQWTESKIKRLKRVLPRWFKKS